jgi:parallel beta-helix repeat protein
LLKVNLVLNTHTTMLLESPNLSWLKLKSNSTGYAHIESTGGSVFIEGVKITSWDPLANDFDHNYKDGRSYVLLRNARMDILNAELGYLGYALDRDVGRGGVYGVSWRNYDETFFGKQLTTGYVLNSRFHHNYFGLYTFGATGMVFRNNEIFENVQYGLDPHDDSNNFIVERNYVHDNGNHGIIFSKRCFNNVIRWNRSENNRLHGVMLDRQSNRNSVYGNVLIGNTDGVAIWDSHNNAIYDNTIRNNKRGIRLNEQASRNLVKDNQMLESGQYGLYLYDGAQHNWVLQNEVLRSREVGIYIRSTENYISANLIQTSGYGIYLTDEAGRNEVQANRIINNTTAIYLKTQPDDLVQNNQFKDNQENIRISPDWFTTSLTTRPVVEATPLVTATPTISPVVTLESTLTPTPTLTPTLTLTRTPVLPSELAPSVYAQVTGTGDYGASVRAGPGANNARLTIAPEDSRVLILKGPRKDENLGDYRWWFVRAEDGTEGWAVQEYLNPQLAAGRRVIVY